MKRIFLTLAVLFSFSAHAASDEESFSLMIWRDFISPVTTRAWIPLAAGSALTLVAYDTRTNVEDRLQTNWNEHKPLGSASDIGDIMGQLVPNAAYFAGMYADYYWGSHDKKSRQRAILMFKASAYAGGMALLGKYTVQERRPNDGDNYSFPSGHAATSFSFAAVIGAEHPWYWGVPAYALATFVGASRINDNMHKLHDVIAGATVGISYGLGLYYRMHQDGNPPSTVYQVIPTDGMDGAMLTMTHEF